jgi:hypothetical protein
MKQTSTQNLLILHTYGETTPEQKEQLAELLANDESLQVELLELTQAKQQLTRKMKSPSMTSLRIIMDYSHKTEQLHEV